MALILLLWFFSALAAATVAAERCSHLQLGLVFVLLAALPPALFACRTLRRKPRKGASQSTQSGCTP